MVAAELESQSASLTRTVNGSHKFVIQGYSLAKGVGVGRHLASEVFSVGGYQWAIYFYPDGKNQEDYAAYVSAFIALASEGTDVRALFELTLVDQSGKGKHKVHSHFERSLESGPYTLKYRGSMWGYKRFFKRSTLESSDFLKDDCLRFNCTVGVVVSATECLRTPSIQVPESDYGAQFGKLLDSKEGVDIAVKVAGETFHAHKLVLAARSPVFRSTFLDGLEEDNKVMTIDDLEPEVFKAILHYMYWDTLMEDTFEKEAPDSLLASSDPHSFIFKLLVAAGDYGLDRLKLMCEARLCQRISIASVAKTLIVADRSHATKLKAICLKYAADNLAAVMQTDGFKQVQEDCPSLQAELLKTVAGCDEDSSSACAKSQSVWAQLSDGGDGGDSTGRRVRQRT